jgi:hypothetical protein
MDGGFKSRSAAAVCALGTKVRPVGTVNDGPAVLPSVTATLGVATWVATVGTGIAVLPTAGTWATGLVLTDPVSRRGTLLWGPVACGWAGFLLEPLGVASNNLLEVLFSSCPQIPVNAFVLHIMRVRESDEILPAYWSLPC